MSDLTDKQRRFIEEYTVDFNATQAAIRAGYAESSAGAMGHENLTKPKIRNRVRQRLEEMEEEARISKAMVITGLLREANRTGDGSSHGARVSAWEKLGKHLGMFTDRLEIDGDIPSIDVTLTSEDE